MAFKEAKTDPKVATHPGELGDHPVGGAVGAIVGAAAGTAAAAGIVQGAAVGSVAGPVGVITGAAVGGVVGALAGKGAAQYLNPTTEDAYWAEQHSSRPYVTSGEPYETYRPAYHHGINSYPKYSNRRFDEIESDLRTDWEASRRDNDLTWDKARPATKDAYERLYNLDKGDKI